MEFLKPEIYRPFRVKFLIPLLFWIQMNLGLRARPVWRPRLGQNMKPNLPARQFTTTGKFWVLPDVQRNTLPRHS